MSDAKVPIGTMMNMAKAEVEGMVVSIMENNHIPADLMIYILDSVQSNLKDMDRIKMSEKINDLNDLLQKKENPD